jgi:L-ascorbate metabolism protein UlaG (beta-lactamase superfamily)
LRWYIGRNRTEWPAWAPSPYADRPPTRIAGAEWRISFVGHATLLLQTAGMNVLTDPFWSERASPFTFIGPRRVNDPGVAFDALPPIDAILVSHCHYDHLDVATLSRLTATHRCRVVTPLGNDAIMRDHDPSIRAEAHDWGDRVELGPGVAVTLAPMRHWAARHLLDRNKHCGPPSSSRRRRAASITLPIPATATARTSARRASGTGRSGLPSCRSAPTNRAGS